MRKKIQLASVFFFLFSLVCGVFLVGKVAAQDPFGGFFSTQDIELQNAERRVVCPDGSGDGDCAYYGKEGLKQAVKDANAGDTVFIKNGRYEEVNLVIDGKERISIEGQNRDEVDITQPKEGPILLIRNSDSITVRKLMFSYSIAWGPEYITVESSSNIIIEENKFYDKDALSIRGDISGDIMRNIRVNNNLFLESKMAISSKNLNAELFIINNTFQSINFGIFVENLVGKLHIQNNSFNGAIKAISIGQFINDSDIDISSNTITGVLDAIFIEGGSGYNIKNNRVQTDLSTAGGMSHPVYMEDARGVTVSGNKIVGEAAYDGAIYMTGSSEAVIHNNEMQTNGQRVIFVSPESSLTSYDNICQPDDPNCSTAEPQERVCPIEQINSAEGEDKFRMRTFYCLTRSLVNSSECPCQ